MRAMVRLPGLHDMSVPSPMVGRRSGAAGVGSGRSAEEAVDLGAELLGVESLDTGRHRAVVVVDPSDRRGLTGYLYLTGVHSEGLERAELQSPTPRRRSGLHPEGMRYRQLAERETLQGLADRITEHTGVRAQVREAVGLDDPELIGAPFVLLTANNSFEFSEAEAANLGRYLASGGFMYAEVVGGGRSLGGEYTYDIPALRELVRAAFARGGYREGKDWGFVRLPAGHFLYHCYYELPSLPLGFEDWGHFGVPRGQRSPAYLEGIRFGDQLVGLYSQRGYSDFWAGEAERIREHDEAGNLANGRFETGCEELPVYDLGVNILVYALTREGSAAQKLVAVE